MALQEPASLIGICDMGSYVDQSVGHYFIKKTQAELQNWTVPCNTKAMSNEDYNILINTEVSGSNDIDFSQSGQLFGIVFIATIGFWLAVKQISIIVKFINDRTKN